MATREKRMRIKRRRGRQRQFFLKSTWSSMKNEGVALGVKIKKKGFPFLFPISVLELPFFIFIFSLFLFFSLLEIFFWGGGFAFFLFLFLLLLILSRRSWFTIPLLGLWNSWMVINIRRWACSWLNSGHTSRNCSGSGLKYTNDGPFSRLEALMADLSETHRDKDRNVVASACLNRASYYFARYFKDLFYINIEPG